MFHVLQKAVFFHLKGLPISHGNLPIDVLLLNLAWDDCLLHFVPFVFYVCEFISITLLALYI